MYKTTFTRLDDQATETFADLYDRALETGRIKLTASEGLMPLVVEIIDNSFRSPWGPADLVSLCHYYKCNGDLCQDPEMCFIVVDDRTDHDNTIERLVVLPYNYYQPAIGIYQESIDLSAIEQGPVSFKMQNSHAVFAQEWLANISAQGYMDKMCAEQP